MRHHLIAFASVLVLLPILAAGQGRGGPRAPAKPTPHWPDGRVNLGPIPGAAGLWFPIDARISVPDSGVGRGQENNFASGLMVGAGESIDRASRIIP